MKDLTTGRPGIQILNFAGPMLLANLFQQAYNIINSIIVGHLLGKEALAAVGATFPVIFTLISFVIGISTGGTTIIAQYFGAGNYIKVRRSIDTIYIFTFIASLLIMGLGMSFSTTIFKLMHLPDELIPMASSYLKTFLVGTIVLFGFNGTIAILRGLGDSKTPLVFMVIATVLNIILDFTFIKYFGWGIVGVAWATVISQTIAFLWAIIYLNRNHKLVKLHIRELSFDREIFRKSLRIGLPSGFQQTFVSLGMIALFRIVNSFGTNVIAAYAVAGRIDNLAMLPAMNFGQALTAFVGQNIGANQQHRVRKGLVATLLLSSLVSITITLSVLLFRFPLMHLFTNDPQVILLGARYLLIVSSCYIVFSTMFSLNGVLRGAGDTLIPMFITLVSLWLIRIPFAALLSGLYSSNISENWLLKLFNHHLFINLGEEGIWWSIPIGWLMGALFSYIYFLSGRWKTKSVFESMRVHSQ